MLEIIAHPKGWTKEMKGVQIGEAEIKLFADNVIIYIENPREPKNMWSELRRKQGFRIQSWYTKTNSISVN